ncbi:glycoside hydrolase family 61 protein [Archangium violaceum]|nr:glycoside hydrolase family 61 protein [Archangium violaceum]
MNQSFSPVFLALLVSLIPAAAFAHSTLSYPPPFDGTTTHMNKQGLCHGKLAAAGQASQVGRQLTLKFFALDHHTGPCMVELRDPKDVKRVTHKIAQKKDCVSFGKNTKRKNVELEWTIRVPSSVKPGRWVLRWSTVSTNTPKPQHFESCAHIEIKDPSADANPPVKPTAEDKPAYSMTTSQSGAERPHVR